MNGIINVFKEQGFTSHDVVAKLRGILQIKKIGHTGTLDPDAVGVLPVCIGKATRVCDMITDWDKQYEAVMQLGVTTDTLDMTGTVLSRKDVNVSERDIIEVCDRFVGEIEQIPPMYSALKQNGKKLYELAREGISVERKPRKVNIKTLRINEIDMERKTVTFTVSCSKGTYIRSLCDDIGRELGTGAAMLSLIRTRVGSFNYDDSFTLKQIEELRDSDELKNHITSVSDVFDFLPYRCTETYDKLLYNGNKLPKDALVNMSEDGMEECKNFDMIKVFDSQNEFVGVYKSDIDCYRPVKLFI